MKRADTAAIQIKRTAEGGEGNNEESRKKGYTLCRRWKSCGRCFYVVGPVNIYHCFDVVVTVVV